MKLLVRKHQGQAEKPISHNLVVVPSYLPGIDCRSKQAGILFIRPLRQSGRMLSLHRIRATRMKTNYSLTAFPKFKSRLVQG